LTADHVIVLGRGRVLADAGISDLVSAWTRSAVSVRSPRAAELAQLVAGPDITVTSTESGLLDITGTTAAAVGDIAAQHGIALHELTPRSGSLEDAYLALTEGSVEYRTQGAAA